MDQPTDLSPSKVPRSLALPEGAGIGIFAISAGLLLFAEQFGLIPNIKWGFPLALCIFGALTLMRVFSRPKV